MPKLGCDSVVLGVLYTRSWVQKQKKVEQNKKAIPKPHQWVAGCPALEQIVCFPAIKTPASLETELGFRVLLAIDRQEPS